MNNTKPAPATNQKPPRDPREERRHRHEEHIKGKDKRRARRWRHFAITLLIILMLLVIIALLSVIIGFDPFNIGYGKNGKGISNVGEVAEEIGNIIGNGENKNTPTNSPEPTQANITPSSTAGPINNVVQITIDFTIIYFGDIPCSDVNELKEKIISTYDGTQKYEFIGTTAVSSTYEDVKTMLEDLQTSLGIEVAYISH